MYSSSPASEQSPSQTSWELFCLNFIRTAATGISSFSFRFRPPAFSRGVGVLSLGLLGCSLATGQLAVRIPDQTLASNNLVYVKRNADSSDIKAEGPNKPIEGEIWIATKEGVYIVDEGSSEATKIPGLPSDVQAIFKLDRRVWISTRVGVFHVGIEDHQSRQVLPAGAELLDILSVRGVLWLLTNKGVYRIDNDTAQPQLIQIPTHNVTSIAATASDEVLLGTSDGAYRATNNTAAQLIPNSPIDIQCFAYVGGVLWLGTKEHGIYYMDSADSFTSVTMPPPPQGTSSPNQSPKDITSITEVNGRVQFTARDSIFTIVNNSNATDTPRQIVVLVTKSPGMAIRGSYYSQDSIGSKQAASQDSLPKGLPPTDYLLAQELMLATDQGLYLRQGETQRRIPDEPLVVNKMIVVNGHPWIATDKGTYRIDRDVVLKVDIQSEEWWWKSIIEGKWPQQNLLKVSGTVTPVVYYGRANANGEDSADLFRKYKSEPQVILEMSSEGFREAVKNEAKEYALPKNIGKQLNPGSGFVYYRIRDRWGNTFEDRIPVVVIPGPLVTSVLIAGLWLLSLLLLITLAPVSSVCFALLMNRNIRRIGYFNLVPIAITLLPPVRLHVLRRYRQELMNDQAFSEWQARFVVPSDKFLPSGFLRLVGRHRKVFLLGESGIGKTSYFKYLVTKQLANPAKDNPLRKIIPIFLPLGRYKGCQPLEMVHTQLASYGQLTDEEITSSFLQRGGFLILFDGLNEVDSATRNMLNTFIERHWITNYFCVSSQEDYLEFAAERIQLDTLNKEKIDEFLRKQLEANRAEKLICNLTPEIYALYKIPQELELAIGLLEDDPSSQLPVSRQELYERKLLPIFHRWELNGNGNYAERLIERAYEMVSSSELSFDPPLPKNPLPLQMKNDLLESRLQIRRDGQYFFIHEQIIAFLAAKYFAPRWRDLLAKQAAVDFNWQPMLRFTLFYLDKSEEIRDLFLALLDKNKFLAIDLFKWLNTSNSDLGKEWSLSFEQKLGQAMLN